MRGYDGVDLSASVCVRFVRNSEIDNSLPELVRKLHHRAMLIGYVDCSTILPQDGLINAIATALDLTHAPYSVNRYASFLDDLITLSYTANGLVIVADSADSLWQVGNYEMFELIESFLTQVHHWLEKKKPCHLCFQMERNDSIRALFDQPH